MKTTLALPLLGTALTSAQVIYTNGSFVCAKSVANYCAGDSLATNIIIRCSGTVGQPGNCNDNLAGIPPVGIKSFAPCYQSSPTVGDAACSFDGNVYPEDGSAPFPISSGGSPASPIPESSSNEASMTTVVSQYTTGTITRTYTVTVPCSTTAVVSTPSPASPISPPSPTTASTAVTVSSCNSSCISSSAAPPVVVPPPPSSVETHPTSAPPAPSEVPGASSAPPAPPASSEALSTSSPPSPPATTYAPAPPPSLGTPVASSPPPAPPAATPSVISSVVVVAPTPTPTTPAVPVGATSTSTPSVQPFTGAAAKYVNSVAGAGIFALAAIVVI